MRKVIICNILVLLILLCAIERYFYIKFSNTWLFGVRVPYIYSQEDIIKRTFNGNLYPDRFKLPDENFKNNKKSILLLGCSYTYGQNLNEKENLSGRLQSITGRWVYNLGALAQDPFFAYMLLQQENAKPVIKDKPEYIIYTYMFHHPQRLSNWLYFNYYRKYGYVKQKLNPLYYLYSYSWFQNRFLETDLWFDWEYSQHQKILLNIISDMKKLTDKMYPDSKFVVLIYSDVNYDLSEILWHSIGNQPYKMNSLFKVLYSKDLVKKLEKRGVEVITTEELIGRAMDNINDRSQNDPNRPHPSSYAWSVVVPKLVERLKL